MIWLSMKGVIIAQIDKTVNFIWNVCKTAIFIFFPLYPFPNNPLVGIGNDRYSVININKVFFVLKFYKPDLNC